jgi:hypothetical protein
MQIYLYSGTDSSSRQTQLIHHPYPSLVAVTPAVKAAESKFKRSRARVSRDVVYSLLVLRKFDNSFESQRNGHQFEWDKRKSFRTGDPENSGFRRTQLEG